MDQFAALHTYASATPTTGGYRLLGSAQRRGRKSSKRSPARRRPAPATPGARMRLTGFLSVLFIGGLGLAVLAGPASCPCSSTFAQHASLERLGYVQNAHFMNATATEATTERVALADAELLGPEASAAGISPITTSALEPARAPHTAAPDTGAVRTVGPLPANIERLSETPPATIKLAAAPSVESDVIPELPAIEVENPPMSEVTAIEAEREVAPKVQRAERAHRKRAAMRAYRTPIKRVKQYRPGDEMTVKRAPKWAQQMFTTPWQSQAFSYTR